jgi:hypothetical protein
MIGNVQGPAAAAKGANVNATQQAAHHNPAHHHVKNQAAAQNTQQQIPKAQAPKGGHINLVA